MSMTAAEAVSMARKNPGLKIQAESWGSEYIYFEQGQWMTERDTIYYDVPGIFKNESWRIVEKYPPITRVHSLKDDELYKDCLDVVEVECLINHTLVFRVKIVRAFKTTQVYFHTVFRLRALWGFREDKGIIAKISYNPTPQGCLYNNGFSMPRCVDYAMGPITEVHRSLRIAKNRVSTLTNCFKELSDWLKENIELDLETKAE